MKIEKDEWAKRYIADSEERIEKLIKIYEVRTNFWEKFLQEFNSSEKVKTFNNKEEVILIESIALEILDKYNGFGRAGIHYRDDESDSLKGFSLNFENDNIKEYSFTINCPFSISKKTVKDYYKRDEGYLKKCKLAFKNIEKSINEVLFPLIKIEHYREDISSILKKNGTDIFVATTSIIEDFLIRNE